MKIFYISIIFLLFACSGDLSKKRGKGGFSIIEFTEKIGSEEERRRFLAEHYWDNLSPEDTASLDAAETERLFLEYVDCLSAVEHDSAHLYIYRCMTAEGLGRIWARRFLVLADKHLFNIESSRLNESLYLPFAEGALSAGVLAEEEEPVYMRRIEVARKNRPGSKATDFDFRLPNGMLASLYGIRCELTLVLFHDPECENCCRTLYELVDNDIIRKLISDGRLAAMMVYTEGESGVWEKHRSETPRGWINCFDDGEDIRRRMLYALRALPSIYLMDKGKVVLLKDAKPGELIRFLEGYVK